MKYSLFYDSPIKKRPKNQFSEMGCFTLVEITCSRGVVNGHNDDRFVAIIVVLRFGLRAKVEVKVVSCPTR